MGQQVDQSRFVAPVVAPYSILIYGSRLLAGLQSREW